MPLDPEEQRTLEAMRYLESTGQLFTAPTARGGFEQRAKPGLPTRQEERSRGDVVEGPVFQLPAHLQDAGIPGFPSHSSSMTEVTRGAGSAPAVEDLPPTAGGAAPLPAPPPLPDYFGDLLADARARLAREREEAERQLRFSVGRQGITEGSAHKQAAADLTSAASAADRGASTFAGANRTSGTAVAPDSLGSEFARITGQFKQAPRAPDQRV